MLNVCCVKVGTKYGPEYVNILFDMVRRNLTEGTPGRFICFTDDPSGLSQGIETRPVPEGVNGWWAKLYLFSEQLFEDGDRVIYFDLDVVITGGLEPLLDYQGTFAALQDKGVPGQINSSIMLWEAGKLNHIWDRWIEQGRPQVVSSDQVWIGDQIEHVDILQILYPGKFFSFKIECLNKSIPPKGAMVAYFHGEPRPHQCDIEWVRNTWRIGGSSADELLMVCNTEVEAVKNNIRAACKRDIPWLAHVPQFSGQAVIVGGAPSLKTKIEEIRGHKDRGDFIIATNNCYSFLLSHGIEADAQVIVDARANNAKFLPEYNYGATHFLASQCDASLFDKADHYSLNTVLWHCLTPELEGTVENPEKKPELIIACGSTVGLCSMGIAYALGYRTLHLFGMDSCYSDEVHHAYEQTNNDGEIVLDAECYGRKFKASAWMLHQANQFQELAEMLMESGCTIIVHGTGLIPWIALNSSPSEPEQDTEIELKDGVWWPSKDVGTRRDVLTTLGNHTDRIIKSVTGNRVAVQAGGNVGLWAKEFSKHFFTVHTFEPDALNFKCLEKNCTESNIVKHNVALGDAPSRKGLIRNSSNCGAHAIQEGDEFDVITVDSLNLDACDLIQLDIEGYELFALKGAEKTINRFKPVICLELKSLGAGYGVTDLETISWLRDHGYGETLKMGRDVIFSAKTKREETCLTRTLSQDSIAI